MLLGVGEECSLLPWVQQGSITSICSPLGPQDAVLLSETKFWVGGDSKCSKGVFSGEQFELYAFLKAVSHVWKLSSSCGPWHGRSGLAQWFSGEFWAWGSLTLSNFRGALQGHSQAIVPTWTQSPHLLLWEQVFLIYFKEAHHWQLGKGVSLPFDLWLCLKKMGCQNAPALKMNSAAATGTKMFRFTC